MSCLVFAIRTVPDIDGGRRLYGLEGIADDDVATAMSTLRYQHTDGLTDVLPHHLQRVVAIAILEQRQGELDCCVLGDCDPPEAGLIGDFFSRMERHEATLISWNGSGFALPVLNYRALLHGISAPRYWDTGEEDHSFRWNNYLKRFHWRHTDLMDALSGFNHAAVASLDDIARLLGFPGRSGGHTGDVWERYRSGQIAALGDDCQVDVLNTYVVYLRFQLLRGQLTDHAHGRECARLRAWLGESPREHLQAFLRA